MSGEQISQQNGQLHVPDHPIIPFIEGDGTGIDIWPAAKNVFDNAVKKAYGGSKQIEWKEIYAGQKAHDKTGDWLPDETIDAIRNHFIAIKGPLTTPVGGGFRSLNVALRQKLDLFVCLRPVRWFQGVPSPAKHPEKVNMAIFRENTEDIYAGIEWMQGTEEVRKVINFLHDQMGVDQIRFPETSSIGIKPISKEGSERLIRAAIDYAIEHNLPSVTLVHKGNIMKYTEGAFKQWGYDLAEREYPDKTFTWQQYDQIVEEKGQEAANQAEEEAQQNGRIIVKEGIADAFLQQIQLRPAEYSVIATMNLNGDYVSDALAAMVGGIGIAPGANINHETGHAIFEATHGTAPKYAGQDKVNPSSLILSGAMMFEHLGWKEVAELIYKGMEGAISNKRVTYDFHRQMEGAEKLSTSEFGEEIVRQMD